MAASSPRSPGRRRAAAALLALPLAPWAAAQTRPERGIVGRPAPELRAEFWLDANGNPGRFSMLEQRGRWVHLKCWQSWCPGCHAHGFPALQKLVAAFAGDPRVVNVAVQTVFEGHGVNTGDKVREMQLRYRLPIPMGHDSGSGRNGLPATMTAYRTGGTPWHVLVDPEGVVVFDGFGIDPERAIAFLRERLAAG